MRVRLPPVRLLPDVLAVVLVAVLIERDVWGRSGLLGTLIAGPHRLTAALPFFLALPLLWRRRFPSSFGSCSCPASLRKRWSAEMRWKDSISSCR